MERFYSLCFTLLFVLTAHAQIPLQYEINQQGGGNCAGSPVSIQVTTSATLFTNAASSITSNTAVAGGNIANDGGQPISQRGVCWNTAPNPTTANNITNDGSGLGTFASNLTGLSSGTVYYARAYAINSAGIFYGNEVSFTTNTAIITSTHSCGATNVHNPNLTYGTMTDQDGNAYKTIVIGTQEWMAENLKASHYRNGNLIPVVTNNGTWAGLTSGATCWFNNDSANYHCPYGKLYNWYAAVDARNICPTGWHVPNDAEWTTLVNYLGGESIAGGKMKSVGTQYWFSPNAAADNSSGFSAIQGGRRDYDGTFVLFVSRNHFWSASPNPIGGAWYRFQGYDVGKIFRDYKLGMHGFSVRCLKN